MVPRAAATKITRRRDNPGRSVLNITCSFQRRRATRHQKYQAVNQFTTRAYSTFEEKRLNKYSRITKPTHAFGCSCFGMCVGPMSLGYPSLIHLQLYVTSFPLQPLYNFLFDNGVLRQQVRVFHYPNISCFF